MTWIIVGALVLVTLAVVATQTKSTETTVESDDAPTHQLDIAAPARPPMRVTRMKVWGELIIRRGEEKTKEIFPASPLGAGEFPTAIWGDDDGTLWISAKLYSGKPGADDGVVYRRTPDGEWHFEYIVSERTLHSIQGRNGHLYAGGMGGYAHFDGTQWQTVVLPEYTMMWKVFADADGVFVQNWDGEFAYRLDGSERHAMTPVPEPDVDHNICQMGDVVYKVFDNAKEVEEVELSPEEEAELRRDFEMLQAALADGTARVKRLG